LVARIKDGDECSLSEIGDIGRAIICAAPGHRLIAADFSGVESRLTAWVSGQLDKVEAWAKFDQTGKLEDEPYYINGRAMGFTGADKDVRTAGKTCDLAFGYMGGVGAWRKLSADDGLPDDEIKKRQKRWRELHPEIHKMWSALDRAAKAATDSPGKTCAVNSKISFDHDGYFLWMHLPSGRKLAYPDAHLKDTDREKVVVFKDNGAGGWKDNRGGAGAYGGTWIENAVQAIARDVFAEAMLRLEAAGYPIVLHVHDEIVCEVPEGFGSEEEFKRLVTTLPGWAEGLPVSAKPRAGHRFSKE
jgi:DNA polymerase